MKTGRRRICAFTLTEILVVLGIIAVLSALLVTVFTTVREYGRRTTCLSNQKQILLALQLYQEDAAGRFPTQDILNVPATTFWIDSLLAYAKNAQIFICPSDDQIENTRTYGYWVVTSTGTKSPTIPSSYLANRKLLVPARQGQGQPLTPSDIVHPATTVFLCDGAKSASTSPPYWTDKVVDNYPHTTPHGMLFSGYLVRDPLGAHSFGLYNESFAPDARHRGRVNVAFVDGHVKSMLTSEWYFPRTPYLNPSASKP